MDQITANLQQSSEQIINFFNQMTGTFIGVMGVALVLLMLAFSSYRILRIVLAASASIGGGALGNLVLAPLIFANVEGLPEGIDYAAIVGIACAFIGWIIAWALHKLAIFLVGAGGGFYGGIFVYDILKNTCPDVEFIQSDMCFWIVCIALAIIGGLLFAYLFKPVYILITGLSGSVAAAYLLGSSIFGVQVNDMNYLVPTLIVGAILGIIASVAQFKNSSDL